MTFKMGFANQRLRPKEVIPTLQEVIFDRDLELRIF
jgi:hypothetical protein